MKRIFTIALAVLIVLSITGCDNVLPDGGNKKIIRIESSIDSVDLYSGEKTQFELNAINDNGEVINLSQSNNFSYKVDIDNVVTVDSGFIKVSNKATSGEVKITFSYEEQETTLKVNVTENPIMAFSKNDDGNKLAKYPTRLDVIINKTIHLGADYKPENLVVPNVDFPASYKGVYEKMYMRSDAAKALEDMFNAAKEDGIQLYAISGYRSYSLQDRIFKYQVKKKGSEEAANKFSARPGESEHQTGLAMDISSKSAGYVLVQSFEETPEGIWLKENCSEYGFVLRYMKGKENITGYSYEPWHFRYVGKDLAKQIMEDNLTIEEYFTKLK